MADIVAIRVRMGGKNFSTRAVSRSAQRQPCEELVAERLFLMFDGWQTKPASEDCH